jgi:hypothetical protein
MPNSQNTNVVAIQDILKSITDSQTAEQELLILLDKQTKTSNYTITDQTQSLIDSINSLSNSRIAMFNSIKDKADILQSGVANSRTDLVAQMTLLGVVEDQLTKSKQNMDALQHQNDTKLRLIQINTYYGKRYAAQSKLMKLIILVCIPILVLFILKRKGLIPELISNYAIGITAAVGAIFIIRSIWDIYTRSNIDFDEYNWNYEDPTNQVPTVWDYNKANAFNIDNPIKNLMSNIGLCVGSNCCANGMYFDDAKQQCSVTAPPGTTIPVRAVPANEGFVCGSSLNGTYVVNYDTKDEERQNGVSPFSHMVEFATIQ